MPYLYNSSFIYYSPVGTAAGPVIPHVFRNGTSLRACKKFLCSIADMSVAEWCGRCLPSKRCCWVSAGSPPTSCTELGARRGAGAPPAGSAEFNTRWCKKQCRDPACQCLVFFLNNQCLACLVRAGLVSAKKLNPTLHYTRQQAA